jgi:hypothetical protein
VRFVLSFIACVFISFLISHDALSLSKEKINGPWILTDVKDSMQKEGFIGMMKLKVEQDFVTFDYGHYKDEGSYFLSGGTFQFVSNRTRKEKIFEIFFQDQMLYLKEPNSQITLIFSEGSVPPFKINSGAFDQRFSSPEKTYALFRKMMREKKVSEAVECFMPHKAGSYYKTFHMLGENFDSFSESLSENIRRRSVTGKYLSYWIKRLEQNREISYTIVFIKTRNNNYLIYQF